MYQTPLGQNNIEAFEELKKAFHAGGNTLASLGIHNLTKYNTMTCTDAAGSFVIGQDSEKFSGKSGQIISGLDITGSDFFFRGTWLVPLTKMPQYCTIFTHILIWHL